MTSPIVRTSNLFKSYTRGTTSTPVLRGVDLQIDRGECTFLVGPSGSGKSTLLSILGCILTPDEGDIAVLDQDIGRLSNKRRTLLRRDHIGFVFQRFHLIRGLTALENASVPHVLQSRPRRASKKRVTELFEMVGLADQQGAYPQNMSAGQCQRVALVRALAADPELILADEPTASLDKENGQSIMKLFRTLTKSENRTAIVVTHDNRIFRFADRILRLVNGGIQERAPA